MSSTEQALAARGGELQTATQEARQQYEIQSAMTLAQRFPRDEALCRKNLLEACDILEFAEDAFYSFPRGKTEIYGPSIHLAREAVRIYGNIWHGISCLHDTDDTRLIRAEAWDLQSNNRQFHEDQFSKIIFRKGKGWIAADERDLRELNNRRGALAERNAIVALLPKWFVDKCVERARETVAKAVAGKDGKGLGETITKIVAAFDDFGVKKESLEQYLGHGVEASTPQEIAKLRGVYKSMKDGYSKWADYIPEQPEGNGNGEKQESKGTLSPEDLAPGKEENRGHGQDNLEQVKAPTAAPEKEPDPNAQPPKGQVLSTAPAQDPAPDTEKGPAPDMPGDHSQAMPAVQEPAPEPGAWKCGKFLQTEIEHQMDRLRGVGWTDMELGDVTDLLYKTRNIPGLEEQQATEFLQYLRKQKRKR